MDVCWRLPVGGAVVTQLVTHQLIDALGVALTASIAASIDVLGGPVRLSVTLTEPARLAARRSSGKPPLGDTHPRNCGWSI